VVYVLMLNKKQSLYEKVLTKIKELVPDFAPNRVITDFEKASINAYDTFFEEITQKSCYFHLSQAIWRSLQKIPNAKVLYETEPEYARHCRMILALAFVPPEDVIAAFTNLKYQTLWKNMTI